MTLLLSRLMAQAHAERVVLGLHIGLTAVVFVFLGMQTLGR